MQNTINKFIKGTKYLTIHSAITSMDLCNRLVNIHSIPNISLVKFVPASGAATRMFKDLYQYLDDSFENDSVKHIFDNIDKLSFYDRLSLSKIQDKKAIIKTILDEYGDKPKALIDIHKYDNNLCNPIDEHIFEAKNYLNNFDYKFHFTISSDHEDIFNDYIINNIEESNKISYSFQKKSTDTLAVDMDNFPFASENGEILYRPGGHGALIENLNEIDSDIIMIKNIDNVCHRKYIGDTIVSKRNLINIGLSVEADIHTYIDNLFSNDYDIVEINDFLKNTLNITYKHELTKDKALEFLNRPLRICGVVKNTGEPGGGPFIVDNGEYLDPQIVEMKEIDVVKDKSILESSEYFNPVDLVCFVKDYQGNKFDLLKYINQDRYFISEKTYKGKQLKALEHPGLWNGAMHNWNTVFVEIPLSTFNPIKSINDLLREGHLGYKL